MYSLKKWTQWPAASRVLELNRHDCLPISLARTVKVAAIRPTSRVGEDLGTFEKDSRLEAPFAVEAGVYVLSTR